MDNKLVIIAQRVDEDDDIVGFFISWIKEFAKNFEKVTIITQQSGSYNLPQNVKILSMGKEKNYSKIRQLVRLWKFLFQEIRYSRGVFVHMSPIFAVLVWPIAFIYRKKIILWYLHRAVSWKLRIANRIVYKIATASKKSLRLKSSKIVELGHGIDMNVFYPSSHGPHHPLRIISVGRISPIKNFQTLLRAIAIMKDKNISTHTTIIGRPIYESDIEYFHVLKEKVRELEIEKEVEFIGHVPHKDITNYYHKSDISVNLTPSGGLDKVVFESMSMEIPSFTSNDAFLNSFGEYSRYFIFRPGDPEDLAAHIESFLSLDDSIKKKILQALSNEVASRHSLLRLIPNISSLL